MRRHTSVPAESRRSGNIDISTISYYNIDNQQAKYLQTRISTKERGKHK